VRACTKRSTCKGENELWKKFFGRKQKIWSEKKDLWKLSPANYESAYDILFEQ